MIGSPQNGQNRGGRWNGGHIKIRSGLEGISPEHAWLITLILVLTPLAVLWYHRVQVDDPYITYRYARNLAVGEGWVYNSLLGKADHVLGTTSPLYAMLLAAGHRLTDDLPLLSSILSGTALGALAFLIYALMARHGEGTAGGIAGILVVLNPLMGDTLGFELNLFLALAFGGLYAYQSERPVGAAFLLGLATLGRGDGFVPAALVLTHHFWLHRRRAWLPFFVYGAVVAAWSGYAIGLFGSPLPNTLAAKQALSASGLWRPYWQGAARFIWMYIGQSPLFLWFGVCVVFGLLRLVVGRRDDPIPRDILWMLPTWALLVAAAYTAMGVAEGVNYYAAGVPALCVLSGLGVVQLTDVILREWSSLTARRNWVRMAVTFPMVAASLTPAILRAESDPEPRFAAYRNVGEWLAATTAADASVGLLEIGIVGYYSNRTIVDMCGLVTPGVAGHVAEGDLGWAIRTRRPDYVLLHDPVWSPEEQVASADWFEGDYMRLKVFSAAEPYRLALYQRRTLE